MDATLGALADPVRRRILELLRERPLSAGEIADRFPISRPAISRHLRVLRESGLVADSVSGRRRVYSLDVSSLAAPIDWLTRLAAPPARPAGFDPSAALDALETEVYRARRERRRTVATDSTIPTEESA
ncbi:metalloregulator ArsR/SmtB family transcription factor [Catenuloplanes atrovinosus]|uniref:DNA-binding transcriptional ArsR family regulator n=1 Tax=Catenuloplanes atrovinosus TaxID=137266 RepID=A0AAE3YPS5_9ACTN|nr:metalloregulator ArsR/SmtB family transcription factor [Catenuloplanes atrovinosus]MDR7276099.1 DNA-binding transcriptional ArsR family regulator [Catenuloplanes atrovinosus]